MIIINNIFAANKNITSNVELCNIQLNNDILNAQQNVQPSINTLKKHEQINIQEMMRDEILTNMGQEIMLIVQAILTLLNIFYGRNYASVTAYVYVFLCILSIYMLRAVCLSRVNIKQIVNTLLFFILNIFNFMYEQQSHKSNKNMIIIAFSVFIILIANYMYKLRI